MPPIDVEKVLAENAAWQAQLIEAFGICPFARQCREEGRLRRNVLVADDAQLPDALTAAIAELHRQPEHNGKTSEVALLICPASARNAGDFERLIHQSADRAAAQVQAEGVTPAYHVVAFHPQMAWSAASPERLVGFWRRAPHPTVQLVHIATLNHLRGPRLATKYVDPDDLTAIQALIGQTVSGDLADRIALANWRTYHAQAEVLLAKSEQLLATRPHS